MKRLGTLFVTCAMLFVFVGCGGGGDDTYQEPVNTGDDGSEIEADPESDAGVATDTDKMTGGAAGGGN